MAKSRSDRSLERQRAYEWLLMMIGAQFVMSDEHRAELQAWERTHVDGSGRYGTSDWPGWVEIGLPPKPVFADPEPSFKRRSISRGDAVAIHRRDEFRCVECGSEEDLTIDHITPVSAGGTNDLDNLQMLCKSCNSSKGARSMEEWQS